MSRTQQHSAPHPAFSLSPVHKKHYHTYRNEDHCCFGGSRRWHIRPAIRETTGYLWQW